MPYFVFYPLREVTSRYEKLRNVVMSLPMLLVQHFSIVARFVSGWLGSIGFLSNVMNLFPQLLYNLGNGGMNVVPIKIMDRTCITKKSQPFFTIFYLIINGSEVSL